MPGFILPAGVGGWLLKLTPGDAQVFFTAVPVIRSDNRSTEIDTKDLEKPPAPPDFLSKSSSSGGKGGGCFVQSAGGSVGFDII
ncbi:MAG: hypothetical protein JRI34_11785 [Deltaproteobacteria bacterium]|nr:hypothetical protein [Deltaproteobacteria bacterium]